LADQPNCRTNNNIQKSGSKIYFNRRTGKLFYNIKLPFDGTLVIRDAGI